MLEKLVEILGPTEEEQDADAAVALLLKYEHKRLRALFVKRIENPADTWSGQIGLPGGKRDQKDKNLKETVIRETWEETNIDLKRRTRFLGVLPLQTSRSKPEFKILPYVILLEHSPIITLNRKELESYIWISLSDLARNKTKVVFKFGETPAYKVGDTIIWGLTYRILQMLLEPPVLT